MTSTKIFIISNMVLVIVAVLLITSFLGVELPSIGKVAYQLDSNEPVCMINNYQGEWVQYNDLDRCCLLSRQQLSCVREELNVEGTQLDWVCPPDVNETNNIQYWLNNKAHSYCSFLRIP